MAVIAKPINPNATLDQEDNGQLQADEAALKTEDGGYQFIWGLVSSVPLQDTHFPNTDMEFSFVYLKEEEEGGFEKYILIRDLSNNVLRHEIIYEKDGTEIGTGHVCKIPLDSGIEYYKPELIDGEVVPIGPVGIEELGTKATYESLKSNSTQAMVTVRSVSNL